MVQNTNVWHWNFSNLCGYPYVEPYCSKRTVLRLLQWNTCLQEFCQRIQWAETALNVPRFDLQQWLRNHSFSAAACLSKFWFIEADEMVCADIGLKERLYPINDLYWVVCVSLFLQNQKHSSVMLSTSSFVPHPQNLKPRTKKVISDLWLYLGSTLACSLRHCEHLYSSTGVSQFSSYFVPPRPIFVEISLHEFIAIWQQLSWEEESYKWSCFYRLFQSICPWAWPLFMPR